MGVLKEIRKAREPTLELLDRSIRGTMKRRDFVDTLRRCGIEAPGGGGASRVKLINPNNGSIYILGPGPSEINSVYMRNAVHGLMRR